MASRQRRELSNADWENLCVLLQRARYEGRVSEALMEANVVAPSQLPLRPASKTKAKAKPKARQMVFNGGHAASSEASSTTETDASKRLAPDGGFTAAGLPEDVAEELLELPEDFMDGFAVVEELLSFPEMAWLGGMPHPPAIPLGNWRRLQYDDIEERIPLPKGIESTRAWGATEVWCCPNFVESTHLSRLWKMHSMAIAKQSNIGALSKGNT